MKLFSTWCFMVVFMFSLNGQEIIDGAFEFQSDPNKKYSLYIPSNYNSAEPQKLMLGLHPFNVNRWDSESWRDTLIVFAETNDLILVCPDGGLDGQIDSPIDTAFTTTLLDSVRQWYNINEEEKYVMGFSVGGRTTYTYGLRRTNQFKGYLVIGAAANLSHLAGIAENAEDESFYLIHGSQDNPNSAFTPLLNALEQQGACTNSLLMNGVGHTIDFPNRNMLLSDAFTWLESTECMTSNNEEIVLNQEIEVYPNPSKGSFTVKAQNEELSIQSIHDLYGRKLPFTQSNGQISILSEESGLFFLILKNENQLFSTKIFVY